MKHSSKCLLEYLEGVNRNSVSLFGTALLEIFESNIKVDRVTLPLLEVFDILFSANVFADLEINDLAPLADRLYKLISKEMFKSKDPRKLSGGIKMYFLVLPNIF